MAHIQGPLGCDLLENERGPKRLVRSNRGAEKTGHSDKAVALGGKSSTLPNPRVHSHYSRQSPALDGACVNRAHSNSPIGRDV